MKSAFALLIALAVSEHGAAAADKPVVAAKPKSRITAAIAGTVAFEPQATGARNATLPIAHNAAGSPTMIALSGSGASAATSSADIPLPAWALVLLGAG